MPGRFSNLEFDDQRRHNKDEGKREKPPVRQSTAGEHLAKAREEDRWGRFESALRLYTRALQEDRAMIAAWVGQVQMLVQLDECHEARLWSDKALELFRNNGELLAAKAQACVRLQDMRAGLTCSDASLQAAGSSPWRWEVRGEVLLANGRKQYEDCFQKALLEPAVEWFDRVIIARIYLYHRNVTNALRYLTEAVNMEPTHGYTWFQLGNCQKALGLIPAAKTSYQRSLELCPGSVLVKQALDELKSGRSLFTWMGSILRRWRGR
ncbi:MAG TPA: tetratricopeptide repeat protein [Phycisphaerae bacterium]|nr:tetratricopeptide repeat protein [Phycisphaerae bacterium]